MKRSPLKPGKPLVSRSVLRCTKPIKAVSVKRRAQEAQYKPLRDAFLEANPWCWFPLGCGRPSTDVHHQRGRFGERLLDQRYWAASCRLHNDYAETKTGDALDLGWLLRIESQETT